VLALLILLLGLAAGPGLRLAERIGEQLGAPEPYIRAVLGED